MLLKLAFPSFRIQFTVSVYPTSLSSYPISVFEREGNGWMADQSKNFFLASKLERSSPLPYSSCFAISDIQLRISNDCYIWIDKVAPKTCISMLSSEDAKCSFWVSFQCHGYLQEMLHSYIGLGFFPDFLWKFRDHCLWFYWGQWADWNHGGGIPGSFTIF